MIVDMALAYTLPPTSKFHAFPRRRSPLGQSYLRPLPCLADILAEPNVLALLIPQLFLGDLLNLILVSRETRDAVIRRSIPTDNTTPGGEVAALQHIMLLISRTTRCESAHKLPVRVGVAGCIWCGEGVCRGCDVSPYIPFSHRLRRLCRDCYCVESPGIGRRKGRFCECRQEDIRVCPECPWETNWAEGPQSGECWMCEKKQEPGRHPGVWVCLLCEKRSSGHKWCISTT
ncbi:hypothetical protein EDC01DRAFT_383701 [Geopyxis carbonaria]|nr:hypothetical protein EDC01DRAFT_383701 [Geopyxis carbonaria]